MLSFGGEKPLTRWLGVLLVFSLALAVPDPASAHSRKIYVNVELDEEYSASQPSGEHWGSVASVSAYYKTTSRALASGGGRLVISPSAIVGTFKAELSDPVPGAPINCTWYGSPGGGHQLAALQDGVPFAGELAIQWPDYPGMWQVSLSSRSTGNCGPTFQYNPLEGDVRWAVGPKTMTGGGNHFIFAAVPRSRAVESQNFSAAISEVTMTSQLDYADGESYSVLAEGFVIESTVPFPGGPVQWTARHLLSLPGGATGKLPPPLGANAVRTLGLKALPKKIPSGCVVGQRRHHHERCP